MTTVLIEDNDEDIFDSLLNNNYCASPLPFFSLSLFLTLSLCISLVKIEL